ncbi:MAG TPA: hypothetical protein VKA38_09660 [Draconibacterium sp.]|nr:hypothetical protein [Draconibacterium sp.]
MQKHANLHPVWKSANWMFLFSTETLNCRLQTGTPDTWVHPHFIHFVVNSSDQLYSL